MEAIEMTDDRRLELILHHLDEGFLRKWLTKIPRAKHREFVHDFSELLRLRDEEVSKHNDERLAQQREHYERIIGVLKTHMERQDEIVGIDDLTQLPMRKLALRNLGRILKGEHSKDTTALGVLFIDLNDFGIINKRIGQVMGDKVLRVIGQIINETIRSRDDSSDAVERVPGKGGRLGGDEFVVTMELKQITDLYNVGVRLHDKINNEARQRELGYTGRSKITAAVGGIACPVPADWAKADEHKSALLLVDLADRQMRKGKRNKQFNARYYHEGEDRTLVRFVPNVAA
jgi:diguanylate cyclase (GGDEF)-like protein